MMRQNANWKNPLMLILASAIWGGAFVAQSVGMDYIGCFGFNAIRNVIGGTVLIPFILLFCRGERAADGEASGTKTLLAGGVCCGIALCIASNLQQMGIRYTTVGKAGFITALYIVLVPILGLFLKKKCGLHIWVSVLIAAAGFYLLSIKEGFRLEKGDGYVLLSAVAFSFQILLVDYFSPKVNGVKLSCIQFWVCGLLSGIVMLFAERPTLSAVWGARIPLLYAGVLSTGVAYTFQVLGQRNYNPTIASLLMSLESVFSALAGWIILHQALSGRELLGCGLIFGAVVLAQLPAHKYKFLLHILE